MTHAELLRKHAIDATNEGGVWFSGEYMTMLASMAESLESENDKLRELCKELLDLCYDAYNQEWGWVDDWSLAYEQAKKLGVDGV